MQLDYDVKPFTFADILIFRYLLGIVDEYQIEIDFNVVNEASDLRWSFKSHLAKSIKRFITDLYKVEEKRV